MSSPPSTPSASSYLRLAFVSDGRPRCPYRTPRRLSGRPHRPTRPGSGIAKSKRHRGSYIRSSGNASETGQAPIRDPSGARDICESRYGGRCFRSSTPCKSWSCRRRPAPATSRGDGSSPPPAVAKTSHLPSPATRRLPPSQALRHSSFHAGSDDAIDPSESSSSPDQAEKRRSSPSANATKQANDLDRPAGAPAREHAVAAPAGMRARFPAHWSAMRVITLAAVFLVAASAAFGASSSPVAPLTGAEAHAILQAKEWHSGCPVALSQLRVLTLRYYGFDRRTHWGKLVVNARFAGKLQTVFAKLDAIRFPIHHMQFGDTYGSLSNVPKDGDFTASFECREASASPCTGATTNKTTGSWSE